MRARTWAGATATSLVVAGLAGAAVLSAVHGDGSAGLTGPTPAAAASPAPPVPLPPLPPLPSPPAAIVRPPLPAPPARPRPRPAPQTVAGLPCALPAGGDGACVSISRQRAWLVRDGRVAMSVPVQTGKAGSTTPVGRFAVLSKDVDHRSREFDDAPMPYSVFFYPGDAFHTGSLSRRSNGCVHLGDAAARTFFSTLSVGDPVQVVR